MMTAASDVAVNVGHVLHRATITVRVSGMSRARARIWLGTQVIKLGGWVIGVGRTRVILRKEG